MHAKLILFKERYYKEILFLLMIIIWAVFYFGMNELTTMRTTHFPRFASETKIPFISWFIFVYISVYFAALAPYFFIKDKIIFKKFIAAFVSVSLASSLIYLIYPVETIRPRIEAKNIADHLYLFITSMARPYNLLPSEHVSSAFLAYFFCRLVNKPLSWLFLIWVILISLSTLFVKQHYVIDIFAGIILAYLTFKAVNKYIK